MSGGGEYANSIISANVIAVMTSPYEPVRLRWLTRLPVVRRRLSLPSQTRCAGTRDSGGARRMQYHRGRRVVLTLSSIALPGTRLTAVRRRPGGPVDINMVSAFGPIRRRSSVLCANVMQAASGSASARRLFRNTQWSDRHRIVVSRRGESAVSTHCNV